MGQLRVLDATNKFLTEVWNSKWSRRGVLLRGESYGCGGSYFTPWRGAVAVEGSGGLWGGCLTCGGSGGYGGAVVAVERGAVAVEGAVGCGAAV